MLKPRISEGMCPSCQNGTLWRVEGNPNVNCDQCAYSYSDYTEGVIEEVEAAIKGEELPEENETEYPEIPGLPVINITNTSTKEEKEDYGINYKELYERQEVKTHYWRDQCMAEKRHSRATRMIMNLAIVMTLCTSLICIFIGKSYEITRAEIQYTQYLVESTLEDEVEVIHSEEEAKETATVIPITDRELIERVVAAEARGEGIEGMMAVAQVIHDRAELWNMTPTEVVTSSGQFAAPYTGHINSDVCHAVAQVFDNGVMVFDEPVTHFYSGSEPYWAEGKVNRGTIRSHTFMY